MGLAARFGAIEARLRALELVLQLEKPSTDNSGSDPWKELLNLQQGILQRLTACEQRLSSCQVSTKQDQYGAASSPIDSDISTVVNDNASVQSRLSRELQSRGVTAFQFIRAPANYYSQNLDYRRQTLGAQSVQQLCKSLVLENTKARHAAADACHAARYFCVIIQYAARLHAEKVRSFLHKHCGGTLGRKQFNMRLAAEQEAHQLTGYGHNAVTPVGMTTKLPILLSHHIANLPQNFFWMGGGEVDLKLGLTVGDFIAAYDPIVVDCTHDEEE